MTNKTVGIVYFSHSGATKLVAEQIAEGAKSSKQTDIYLMEVLPSEIVEGRYVNQEKIGRLSSCDAILFGSPTYMGSPSAQFKAFMDASSDPYCDKAWRNKLAGGFTTGGSLNGEQQQTLFSFFTLACQHGMIWAGLDVSKHTDSLGLNRTGSNIGLVSSAGEDSLIHENDLRTAFYYGERIAHILTKDAG